MNTRKDAFRQLQAEFQDRAVEGELMFLLRPRDAIAYIDAGCDRGLSLLGVEGFIRTEGGAIQPRQELSNDIDHYVLSDQGFVESTKQLILGEGERMQAFFEVAFGPIDFDAEKVSGT